jgi:hypothetical protein
MVPQAVVDGLEAIDVEHQQRGGLAVAVRATDRAHELLLGATRA